MGIVHQIVACLSLLLWVTAASADPKIEKKELSFSDDNRFEAYEKGKGLVEDTDISAATCLASGLCFAASDETRFLQTFAISGDTIAVGKRLYLSETKETEKAERREFDIEALASHGDQIIAVGSHSWKRNKCKNDARRQVVFIGEVDKTHIGTRTPMKAVRVSLQRAFLKFPKIKDSFNTPLQQNGLNIEGVTVLKEVVYFGFRAPYLKTNVNAAFILSIKFQDLVSENFEAAKLHQVQLAKKSGVGIRGLDTFGDRIVILAGDSGVKKGKKMGEGGCEISSSDRGNPFSLSLWRPGSDKVTFLSNVQLTEDNQKAEGILVLKNLSHPPNLLSAVVFFDKALSGKPVKYTIKMNE